MNSNGLTNEWLERFFDLPNLKRGDRDMQMLEYAKTPYATQAEYERDKQLISTHSTSSKPQDKFMLIVAAKLDRSPEIRP